MRPILGFGALFNIIVCAVATATETGSVYAGAAVAAFLLFIFTLSLAFLE